MKVEQREWFERLRAGDQGALDGFYTQNRSKFIAWSKRNYQLNEIDALDIYQDAIIIFYNNVATGKASPLKADVQTYLFGIAKNLILKYYRKERMSEKKHELWKLQLQDENELSDDFAGTAEKAMLKAIESLKEPCQTILKLFYYYEKDFEFIANQVGHTDKNVTKTQKSRCLGYLKEKYLQSVKDEN